MAQTTTVIFLLATLLMAATTVSGQGPHLPLAPSPSVNEVMNCAAGLAVCLPAITQGGPPLPECCTALETAVKTQLPCLCGLIKSPTLLIPFNVTAFNALLSQTCGITTDPNMCSEKTAQAPLPHTAAPVPGPPNKNAASKLAGTGLVGIVLITIVAMFY
ncbi:Bifunctional inhibitor/plant lipid transfer protein/seed storage helical domain [Arabidopsis thaliana x Arabidopsis arenosa]|uniref:Bifunctional inhibitor/plant lipid transfer protein/seed storage helical domain n=1 Tax=Arabidopsis thaliana x Arabidopsis arenosa TaxID=1240361 RepID=A0A8T1Z272_9BRAS|nr:Bifunctional inhibitor/plant lipid transfer protein/seed storage helical domain [Arabidopsis thaliana x Arabidopsis arenosa]